MKLPILFINFLFFKSRPLTVFSARALWTLDNCFAKNNHVKSQLNLSDLVLFSFPPKASDTLGDFIRRSPKIAKCARWSDCDFRRSPRSAYKIADIWHVRYRRLNSPAFAKCARSRDFLRSFLRITSEVNPSGWAILSHEFLKLPHHRDRRKKSPSVSASISSLAIKFAAIGV